MAVAKTYTDWERVGEVFTENNREYINVKHPKTGALKKVRWYSDYEYAKMYQVSACVAEKPAKNPINLRKSLGFDKGYITIFKGNQFEHNEWFKQSNARFHRDWKWYVVSTEEVPTDLPEGLEPVQLKWEDVADENGYMKSDAAINYAVDRLMYDESPSEFIGEVGQRITSSLKINKAIPVEGAYGTSTIHIMSDENDNVFVWTTAAKTLTVDATYSVTGTIKEHKVYRGTKQTILTRCKVVKED